VVLIDLLKKMMKKKKEDDTEMDKVLEDRRHMPLKQGSGVEVVHHNIRKLVKEGRSIKQSIAIAFKRSRT